MKDEDIQNLLGGFATDTLTDREREVLFTAALHDQKLFDALADEQVLRDFLSDPAARRKLLDALQPAELGIMERLTSWMRLPASWGVAGAVLTALVAAVALRQPPLPILQVAKKEPPGAPITSILETAPALPPAPVLAPLREIRKAKAAATPSSALARSEDFKPPENVPTPASAPAAASAPAPPPPSSPPPQERKNELVAAVTSPAKLKLVVLDFDSGRDQSKETNATKADVGKTASEMLGKKLDSSGYTIIDRKEVDKALEAQNISKRQLDAITAASVGRSVGADAVILGSVKQGPVGAKQGLGIGGFRQPMARAKVAARRDEVQVTAQAINTQNAGNLAFAQGEQSQQGGLADAVDQVASSLGQQIQQNTRLKVDGLVTDVNAAILTLNIGAKAGLKVGDRLEVRRAGKPIGRVVISTVKDSFSVGAFEGTGPVKIGDAVTNQ